MHTEIQGFFDAVTSTVSYVVYEADGGECAIIDPVLDYDAAAGRISTTGADTIAAFVQAHDLKVQWLLETHAHADHLSASAYLKRTLGGRIGIGAPITQVQSVFRDIYNLEPAFKLDGSQFDHLFQPDEEFRIGRLHVRALHVPGHTPADMAYQVEHSNLFVGDTLFMPDGGSARCDFPGGSAATLYQSIHRLFALPDATRVFVCHDYGPNGRAVACETSIGEQKRSNIHVRDGIAEAEFVRMREARDATLAMPTLILPSVQVNIRAGALPDPDANGVRYLKLPIDTI